MITLFDYCGIDIQPVKFGTPNAPQFDIDPSTYGGALADPEYVRMMAPQFRP